VRVSQCARCGCSFRNRYATRTSSRRGATYWRARSGGRRIRFVKAKGVIECAGAALRATIAVARRLDVKEFAQCADVGSSDAGLYCSLVLRSAVRRLTPEVAGAAVAVPFIRCRSSSPIRCRPRLCTTRRIGAGTVGREPIAVTATAVAAIGDPCGWHLAVLRGHTAMSCPAHAGLTHADELCRQLSAGDLPALRSSQSRRFPARPDATRIRRAASKPSDLH